MTQKPWISKAIKGCPVTDTADARGHVDGDRPRLVGEFVEACVRGLVASSHEHVREIGQGLIERKNSRRENSYCVVSLAPRLSIGVIHC